MGKKIYRSITTFGRGMTTDRRLQDNRYAQLIKNFDAHTFEGRLMPYRSSESADSAPDTRKAANFTFGNGRIYGLGVVSGTSRAAVNYKTTGDLGGTSWTSPSNGESSAGTRDEDFFIQYKNYIYGARAGTNLWRHGDIVTGSPPTWSDSWQSLSYTNMAQGLWHTDDILYIPYDNKIATWDNSTFTAAKLTLPSDRIVTSIFSFGDSIGIAARPSSGSGNSKIYLWDGTAPSWYDVIDWGEGDLYVADFIDGTIIGISIKTLGVPSAGRARVIFRAYNGGATRKFLELVADSGSVTTTLDKAKQISNNHLYFLLKITLNGTEEAGLWKVGRNTQTQDFAVTFDRTPKNDTALTSGTLEGFFIYGDYALIAFIKNSAYDLTSTDDQANYNHTSVYETLVLNEGDSRITKKLIGATLLTEPIPSGGSAVLKYKKDEESSFTTLLTSSTQNDIRKSELGTFSYKELTFRIEATDGVVPTGIAYLFELENDDAYDL